MVFEPIDFSHTLATWRTVATLNADGPDSKPKTDFDF